MPRGRGFFYTQMKNINIKLISKNKGTLFWRFRFAEINN
jgi:hypothetical protein